MDAQTSEPAGSMTTWDQVTVTNWPSLESDFWDNFPSFVEGFGNPTWQPQKMDETTAWAQIVHTPTVIVDPDLQSCFPPGEMSSIPAEGPGISSSGPSNSCTAGSPQSTSRESPEQEQPPFWAERPMTSTDITVSPGTSNTCTPAFDSGTTSSTQEGLQQEYINVWDATNTSVEETKSPRTTTENEASTADTAGVSEPAKKRRKVIFSDHQVNALQDRFQAQKYLKPTEIQSLAVEIGLKYTQVMTWFQNKRMKTRRRGETIIKREAKPKANKKKRPVCTAPRIHPVQQQMMPLASMNQPPQNISFYQASPQNVPGFVSYIDRFPIAPQIPASNNATQLVNYFLPPSAFTVINSPPTLPAYSPVAQK